MNKIRAFFRLVVDCLRSMPMEAPDRHRANLAFDRMIERERKERNL